MDNQTQLDAFYAELENDSLQGLWRVVRNMMSRTPSSPARPFHWQWPRLRRHLDAAAELIGVADIAKADRVADRRVLVLVNPGLKERNTTTPTIAASLQLIRPGEVAPAHRHSSTAIRFMIDGHGAFSAVDGEKFCMEPGDLVLTPSMAWHNHGNETDRPVVWMDGLDAPLMMQLCAFFYDDYPKDEHEIVRSPGFSVKKYAAGGLRPMPSAGSSGVSPLWHYRFEDAYRALSNLAQVEVDPVEGAALDYVNPLTGGHALPTIGCRIQLLPAGFAGAAHRHTGHVIYHVVKGEGCTTMGEERFPWQQGDCFVLPPWLWHKHESAGHGESILFSMSDVPVLEALQLYKEELQPQL